MKVNKVLFDNRLHIYAQEMGHEPAVIVGDTEGLTKLREAIDLAIDKGKSAIEVSDTIFAADGEGYSVIVVKTDGGDETDEMMLPYVGTLCMFPDSGVHPLDMDKVMEAYNAATQ